MRPRKLHDRIHVAFDDHRPAWRTHFASPVSTASRPLHFIPEHVIPRLTSALASYRWMRATVRPPSCGCCPRWGDISGA